MVMNYGYNYNPMMTAQQRLNQMESQYPQFSQQPVMKVIPVTNIEEANATQVDIQGTPTFFYNQSKNEVYMKRVNLNTGLADFIKFEATVQPLNESKTKKDVITYEKDLKLLNDKIDGLYSLLKPKEEKGTKNGK